MASDLWLALSEKLTLRTEIRFPELPFENGTLIPTIGDLPAGKDEIGSIFLDGSLGEEAILLAPGASDIPLTQVTIGTERIPVVMAAKGYSISWQEKRAMTGLDIASQLTNAKIDIVRKEIAKRLNRFAALGEPVLGMPGLYSSPKISIVNSSFNPNTATFQQWTEFLVGTILNAGLSADGEILLEPTTVLIPPRMAILAQTVTSPNNNTLSVLDAVGTRLKVELNNGYFIRSPYSASAMLERYGVMPVGTNKDRIVVYSKSDAVLCRRIENVVAQLVDEEFLAPTQGLTRMFPFFSCSSATQIIDPSGIRYIDVTKVL